MKSITESLQRIGINTYLNLLAFVVKCIENELPKEDAITWIKRIYGKKDYQRFRRITDYYFIGLWDKLK